MIFFKKKYVSNLIGGTIYMMGDSIATLITNEFSISRALGIFVVGAAIYAFEIQRYFSWIEEFVLRFHGLKKTIIKTMLALVYFNPLWIARHLCFIYFISGRIENINLNLLKIALISFSINIPISITANYIIQNKLPFRYHFFGSAIFSGLMAIYYSMSIRWF